MTPKFFDVRDSVELSDHLAVLMDVIAGIVTLKGVIHCELRNDESGVHLFVPKTTLSYDQVLKLFPGSTLAQRKQLRAITPLNSSEHIKRSLVHEGFTRVNNRFIHGEGITFKMVTVKSTEAGDELYITNDGT